MLAERETAEGRGIPLGRVGEILMDGGARRRTGGSYSVAILARIQYRSSMKTVSIDELKRNLSAFIDEAAKGERIVITKHRRPVAALAPATPEHVHVGKRFGRAKLRPLFKAATKGAYLDVLLEDRRHDRLQRFA